MIHPLNGVRVVVTRARHQAASLGDLLGQQGARVVYLPVIAIAPPERWEPLEAALRRVASGEFAWVVFTSANAVRFALERAREAAVFARVSIAAVGAETGASLREHGVKPDLVPSPGTAAAVVAALGPGSGRVLLPRVAQAPGALPAALRAAGWWPEEVEAYRNVPAPPSSALAEVEAGRFDAVTFASGSAVRNFSALISERTRVRLAEGGDKLVACIGPETAAAARAEGLGVDVVAANHTAAGLVAALSHIYAGATRMAP